MKKNDSNLQPRNSGLFSHFLHLLMIFALTVSPIAATAVTNSNLSTAQNHGVAESVAVADQSPQMLIPATVFSNATAINIPDDATNGVTSTITVTGTAGPISSIALTLNNYTTPRPQHVDFLLVGPGGQKFVVMSDAGGQNLASATSNVTITFSDAGASQFTQSGPLTTGTFKPVDYDVSVPFPTSPQPYQSPAPLGSATFGSVFGGLSGASVNGNWVLHVFDSAAGPGGTSSVAGGWSLDIVTTPTAAATTTVLSSSANPSFTNQAITLTATVTSASTVNTGVVNFVDNTTSTALCTGVAVNGSGVATCNVPANTLTERIHQITATYVANATFATSNGSINQAVNNPTQVSGTMFTNPGTIVVGDTGGTSTVPYPSNIFVSGLTGTISKVTVSLQSVNIPETGDLDFLLVGPGGQKYVFWSDAGGGSSASTGTFVLDDTAGSQLPASGSIAAGTYKPADYAVESDVFPAPAPAGPYSSAPPNGISTFASVFGGAAPNGTWSLYVTDDSGSGGITSSIAGWKLTFTTSGDAATTTTLTSSPNPSTTSQAILFTASVTSTSTVNSGTVTFRRGVTVLCANVAVNASGVATCNVSAGTIPQGTHVITADYNGSPGQFNISSGTTTQQVDSPTVVTCLNFANNGGITVSNTTTLGNPYPSNIVVGGLGGSISKVTLTMNIGSALTPDHNDFLLVGPGGQKFMFMSDAGGTTDIVNQTITLDDAAATALPDSTAIVTGTYRPAAYTGDVDAFPAPAPAGPYTAAAPEGAGTFAALFNGINPNGTWQLYAVEDAGDGADTIINNWSLTFTLAAAATTTSVTSSADPSVFGQSVTFTATVSTAGLGTPSGNVQFFDGATPIGSPVALNASGVATLATTALSVGNHTITAQYSGSSGACTGTFNSSTGSLSSNPQTVNKANTTTGVISSANPVGTGVPVTFTTTVNAVAPGAGTRTGTATFFRNGSPICSNVAINASGQATCQITFTIAGNYNITVQYSGDGNFNASSSSTLVEQVVGPTAANVSVSGRIVSADGRGIPSARVFITDSAGYARYIVTNPFGYYRFLDVQAGGTYIISVSSKGYVFEPSSIVRQIGEDAADVDFVGNR
ncbi:MAG: Ig-like domain repeat protein [Acidobacteriota bacterium]